MNLNDTAGMVRAVTMAQHRLGSLEGHRRVEDLIQDLGLEGTDVARVMLQDATLYLSGGGFPEEVSAAEVMLAFGIHMFLIGAYHERLRDGGLRSVQATVDTYAETLRWLKTNDPTLPFEAP